MKLAFSKSSSKTKPAAVTAAAADDFTSAAAAAAQIQPEFVNEYDPSKTLISTTRKSAIIPPKENEWRPFKKMKNLDLPPLHSGDSALDFEQDDVDIAAADDSGVTYGLNVRHGNDNVNVVVGSGGSGGNNGKSSGSSIDAIMMRQFKSDLDRLPEEQGFDQYEDTPVDGFGAALLAGYGWQEGRGIGKNAKEDTKVIEYKRRTAKEGLGFMADDPPAAKVGGDDKGKENGGGGKSEGVGVGMEVRIVRGSKMGLKGTVIQVLGGSMVVLDVEGGRKDTFRVDDVAELGSVEEDKCLKKLKELKIRDSRDDRRSDSRKSRDDDRSVSRESRNDRRNDSKKGREDRSVSRESKRNREDVDVGGKHERVQREEKSSNSRRMPWLMSHIRVRIISKEFKGGRYYLKKGEVVDVIGPGICDLSMDDGRKIVQAVDQDILETALPRRGGPVVVLLGKHKGVYGKLVEKDSEKETGVVQDADSQEMFHVRLEEIAEFLGDPSYLGY